ncbi:MAG: hypothetical protein HFI53_04275 [Lachnospiraceae bacterium]|nr:hypothetical protein [Lachnospiraceae bacterium]
MRIKKGRLHRERQQGWFCLGTEENPLCGAFDGDGHRIQGRFPLMDSVTPRAMFHMEESAVIENMELCNDLSPGEIRIAVKGGLMSA